MNKIVLTQTQYNNSPYQSSPIRIYNYNNYYYAPRQISKSRRGHTEFEYSPPKYGGNTTTNTMANYNISTPTIQQPSRFPPIGTKRSGSPVRTANLPLNIKNVSTPNSMDGQQSNELFGKNTIWSYSTVKPMAATEPKDKVIYGKRDILDLAGNMKDAKWQYRPAQLPIGNTRMFFENRSQYHRLATFEQTDEKFDECLTCNFLFPKF